MPVSAHVYRFSFEFVCDNELFFLFFFDKKLVGSFHAPRPPLSRVLCASALNCRLQTRSTRVNVVPYICIDRADCVLSLLSDIRHTHTQTVEVVCL